MSDLFKGKRDEFPILTGLLDYFPNACAAVARCSFVANEQHNPGEPMRWAMEKSVGDGNQLIRHLMQRGTLDTDGIRHSAKMAWRAFEYLEREILAERAKQNEVATVDNRDVGGGSLGRPDLASGPKPQEPD